MYCPRCGNQTIKEHGESDQMPESEARGGQVLAIFEFECETCGIAFFTEEL